MSGQLWQECPKCGTEPVCLDCEYCSRHCHCGKPQPVSPECPEPYRRGIGQGFGSTEDGQIDADEVVE